ncbi:MAG: sulfate adenylyltransferase, partial [Desulfurococcales archaeon ex4484_42]
MVSKPHGGKLVNRVIKGRRREHLLEEVRELPKIALNESLVADLMNIAHGVYSPLEGFLTRDDFEHVLYDMRLSNDVPWSIPIVLDVSKEEAAGLKEGDDVALTDGKKALAIMKIEEIYEWDKKEYCRWVFKTVSPEHPGVVKTMSRKELLIGGPIDLLNEYEEPFEKYRLWPIETRVLFEMKKWRTIAGFQTRNIPHLGHE